LLVQRGRTLTNCCQHSSNGKQEEVELGGHGEGEKKKIEREQGAKNNSKAMEEVRRK